MKLLLVGGTSALGSVLRPVLSEFADVTTAGRRDCDLHIDLAGSAETITWSERFDAVIQVAAQFGGDEDAAMLEAEHVNVLGTLRLCQAARKAGAGHFVLISSIFALLPESSPQFGIYALSKRHGEELARFYCKSHALPLAIVRPSQIYGSSERFRRHQPFFYAMADRAERGDDITLYGTHDPRRNYIHAEDVASAIAKVVERRVEGAYACQYPSDVTYAQIARAAYVAFGANNVVHFREDQPDIPDNVFELDDTLYREIEWAPQVSIADGMKKLAHYRRTGASVA